jgi:hypothetical protein
MLKTQASAWGSETTSASTLASVSAFWMRASFETLSSPAKAAGCALTGAAGGAGRSLQSASISWL